jgi:ketosteroid isomerase-like protein
MPQRGARESIDAYFKAVNERRVDDIAALMDPHIVIEWPQSGERFRGRDTYKAVFTNYPGLPKGEKKAITGAEDKWVVTPSWTPLQIVGTGDDYTIEGYVTYPNGERWSYVAIVKFRDGLVIKLTEYFAEPFPPADWRAEWAEKTESPRAEKAT